MYFPLSIQQAHIPQNPPLKMTTFPDHPSYEVKVRTAFEDFDLKKTRALTYDSFTQSFARLGMSLPVSSVQHLFTSSDTNKDEHITYPEWQAFAERYPTLLDCLYYRAKDYWGNVLQKENIEKASGAVALLREAEAGSVAEHATAQRNADSAAQAVQSQAQRLAEAGSREAHAKNNAEMARRDTEAARAELLQRQHELATAKDHERLANTALSEAQHAVEACSRRLQSHEAQLSQSEARLREIERLLSEQRAAVEEHRADVDHCKDELNQCEGRAREAGFIQAEALRVLHSAGENVARAEEDVVSRQHSEKDAQSALRQAQLSVMSEEAAHADTLKRLALAKEEEEQKAIQVEASRRAVEAAERDLLQLEQDEREFVKQRLRVNDQEAPLIEREVNLRAERSRLENSEARLVADFVTYTGRSGGGAVVGGGGGGGGGGGAPGAAGGVVHPPALPSAAIQRISSASPRVSRMPPSPGRGQITPRLASVRASPAR